MATETHDREAALCAAVERNPADAAAHGDLAAHYFAVGKLDESVHEYSLSCELAPDVPEGHYNLAATLNACGDTSAALNVIELAEQHFPDNSLIHYGKACILQSIGRPNEALTSFTAALELNADHADAWYGAGVVLLRQGDYLRASNIFERALDAAPDHAAARYMHDALSGAAQARPHATFVRELFDSYATYYDEHMVETLGYRAPEMLCDTVATHLRDAAELRILDLGCGTGLVGSRLQEQAGQLVGVDLASGMLDQAKALECYDRLECCDVVEYLNELDNATQDLVVAADLFIYFAELEEAFAAIRRVLTPGGLFAFTVEEHQDEGWSVGPSGRFRHSREYLEDLRDRLSYTASSFERTVLRHDGGEPCQGFIVAWSSGPETNLSP